MGTSSSVLTNQQQKLIKHKQTKHTKHKLFQHQYIYYIYNTCRTHAPMTKPHSIFLYILKILLNKENSQNQYFWLFLHGTRNRMSVLGFQLLLSFNKYSFFLNTKTKNKE